MLAKNERRKLLWAIAGSILVHLVVAFSLAAFAGVSNPVVLDEEKPPELTLVDLAATPPSPRSANPPYMETDDSKKSVEQPNEKTFASNANSVAASEKGPNGENPLPAQEGHERPYASLETRPLSFSTEGAKPQPQVKDTPAPQPTETPRIAPTPMPTPQQSQPPIPTPTVTPPPEQFAMLTSTPPPAFTPPEVSELAPTPLESSNLPPVPRPQPERPDSSFQSQKEQTRITGRISNRGRSAVNAVETPLGRYQKAVSDAIGSRWYHYMNSKMDLVSIGTAHVEAQVDAQGHIQNLKLLSNNANEAFANICLQSFQEAQIPPIPEELVSALPEGRLPVDIFFTAYANR